LGLCAFVMVALYMMFSINATITLVAIAPLLVITVLARLAAGRIEHYRRASRQQSSRVTAFIPETFGAVEAVKVASAQNHLLRHFRVLNQDRQRISLSETLFNEILVSISLNSINISTGLILLLSVNLIREGAFSIADFALFIYYLELLSQ